MRKIEIPAYAGMTTSLIFTK